MMLLREWNKNEIPLKIGAVAKAAGVRVQTTRAAKEQFAEQGTTDVIHQRNFGQ